MGRLFLIDLSEREPVQAYYLCRARECRTHIALLEHAIGQDSMDINSVCAFHNVVNVVIDGPAHYTPAALRPSNNVVPGVRLANIHCVKCNQFLGSKVVQVGDEPNFAVTLGEHHLYLRKLLVKNGNQLLYANNWQPYQDV